MSNIANDLPTREVNVAEDMAMFDSLPFRMREALNYCGGKYAAEDFAGARQGGKGMDRALKRLDAAERRFGFRP